MTWCRLSNRWQRASVSLYINRRTLLCIKNRHLGSKRANAKQYYSLWRSLLVFEACRYQLMPSLQNTVYSIVASQWKSTYYGFKDEGYSFSFSIRKIHVRAVLYCIGFCLKESLGATSWASMFLCCRFSTHVPAAIGLAWEECPPQYREPAEEKAEEKVPFCFQLVVLLELLLGHIWHMK